MPRLPRAALIGGVVGLLLVLLLGAGLGPSAQGIVAQAAGTLTLSPTSGAPGTHVFLHGSGFTPGESVKVYWAYSGPGTGILQKSFYEYNPTVVADASGNAVSSLWVSAAAAGNYGIAAVGQTSGTVASATYQLTPSVDIGQAIGPAGSTLRFTGWAFGAKEAIQVYWDYQQSDQALATKASTDSKGDWGGKTFATPSNATTGAHTITAIGQTSGAVATTTFTVGAIPQGPAPSASDWATFGYDLQNTRVNPTETTIGVGNVATLAPKWAEMTPFTPVQKTVASPVVANGVVYLGTTEGQMLAYDLSGNLLWSFNATAPIYGSPAIGNGIVYFGTVKTPNEAVTGNYIYALNASTGALVWENFLSFGSLWSPPTYYNGVVYAEAAQKEGVSGGFYAFDALTGATVWSTAMPSGNWSVPVFDPSGANLYMATGNPCVSSPPGPPWNTPQTDGCSGSLFDLNPATGATVWSYHFPDYSGDDDAPATPVYAVVNGTPELFEGVKNGIFYCLNAATGAVQWQYDTGNRGDSGIYSSAAYYNGVLYFGGYKTLYALNASDGSVALTFSRQPVGTIVSSPAIANGVLYVTTESGNLTMYNVTTGAWIRTIFFQIPGSKYGYTIYGSPVVSNGVVYVPVSDGNLYAFSPNGQ
ncbi:MAG TPA: PQQ-binding-like beta-propeller repeat protein [Ktedonobacterales bacterium]|nr:PQQ-binding-like beta-propeller repeat protein [Ktedonobacterales bacterium]